MLMESMLVLINYDNLLFVIDGRRGTALVSLKGSEVLLSTCRLQGNKGLVNRVSGVFVGLGRVSSPRD